MFGYVIPNEQELKIKEYNLYRSYYCGFCKKLREKYSIPGQMTLSYDMTFLIMVLCDLYDKTDTEGHTKCIAHPFISHPTRINDITEYAADINLILAYYACLDDWNDEKKLYKLAFSGLLSGGSRKAAGIYGRKAAVIKDRLDRLHEAELENETDIDKPAGYFGDIMAEIFAIEEDEWENALRKLGFFLGKFIYIMDAYDDMEKDRKNGSYNPLLRSKETMDPEEFDDYVRQILTMMLAKSCEAFEILPCIENVAILRNILYSGVWTRYNAIQEQKNEKNAQEKGQSS